MRSFRKPVYVCVCECMCVYRKMVTIIVVVTGSEGMRGISRGGAPPGSGGGGGGGGGGRRHAHIYAHIYAGGTC